MAETVTIQISLDQSQAERAIRALEKSTKDVGQSIESNLGKNFNSAFSGLAKRALALGGILATALAGKAAIRGAIEQENAINRLNASLRSAGIFSSETSKSILAFADNIENTTTLTAEAALEVAALSSAFGKTAGGTIELSTAAIGLSKAFGIDTRTAVTQLGASLSGTAGRISQLVPEVRNLTKEQLQNGEAIKIVAARYASFAEAEAATFGGRITQLSNIFGKLSDAVGNLVVQSPSVRAVLGLLTKALISFVENVENLAKGQDPFKPLLLSSLAFAKVLNIGVLQPLEIIGNIGKAVFDGIVFGLQAVLTAVAKVGGAIGSLVSKFSPDSELARNLQLFSESASLTLDQLGQKFETSVDPSKLFDASITDRVNVVIDDLNRVVEASSSAQQQLSATTNAIAASATAQTKSIREKLQPAYEQFGQSVASGFSQVGRALVKGGDAFGAFKNVVFNALGDLLITTGITVSGFGNAMTSLAAALTNPFTAGPAAIGVGLLLIALGGALKGIAEGGASGGNGIGGTNLGPTAPVSSEPPSIQEQVARVTVNISGDVLDSQSTSLRIVELIKEATDNQGANLRFA